MPRPSAAMCAAPRARCLPSRPSSPRVFQENNLALLLTCGWKSTSLKRGEYVRYAYRSLPTYLLSAVHLLKNSGPSIRRFFDNFTLHYIAWASLWAFLNNADIFWHKKPRWSRPYCMWNMFWYSVHFFIFDNIPKK